MTDDNSSEKLQGQMEMALDLLAEIRRASAREARAAAAERAKVEQLQAVQERLVETTESLTARAAELRTALATQTELLTELRRQVQAFQRETQARWIKLALYGGGSGATVAALAELAARLWQ